jgi:osmotically-inducible protein OsmY
MGDRVIDDVMRRMRTEGIDTSHLVVRAYDHTLTLLGKAASAAERALAERVASRTPGVEGVTNELVVRA